MIVEEKKVILHNNEVCLLRNPKIEDASDMIDFMKTAANQAPYLLRYSDEIDFTVQQGEEMIQSFNNSKRNMMIIVEINNMFCGYSSIAVVEDKRKVRHRCQFAICLAQNMTGLGLGKILMNYVLEIAKSIGYEQIELEVISGNTPAISLYKKMGFKDVGRIPEAFKYEDGTYLDEIIMMKSLNKF